MIEVTNHDNTEFDSTKAFLAEHNLSLDDELVVTNMNHTVQLSSLCDKVTFNTGRWVLYPMYFNRNFAPPLFYDKNYVKQVVNYFGHPISQHYDVSFCDGRQRVTEKFHKRFFFKTVIDSPRAVTTAIASMLFTVNEDIFVVWDADTKSESGMNRNHESDSDQLRTIMSLDFQRDKVASPEFDVPVTFASVPMKRFYVTSTTLP